MAARYRYLSLGGCQRGDGRARDSAVVTTTTPEGHSEITLARPFSCHSLSPGHIQQARSPLARPIARCDDCAAVNSVDARRRRSHKGAPFTPPHPTPRAAVRHAHAVAPTRFLRAEELLCWRRGPPPGGRTRPRSAATFLHALSKLLHTSTQTPPARCWSAEARGDGVEARSFAGLHDFFRPLRGPPLRQRTLPRPGAAVLRRARCGTRVSNSRRLAGFRHFSLAAPCD